MLSRKMKGIIFLSKAQNRHQVVITRPPLPTTTHPWHRSWKCSKINIILPWLQSQLRPWNSDTVIISILSSSLLINDSFLKALMREIENRRSMRALLLRLITSCRQLKILPPWFTIATRGCCPRLDVWRGGRWWLMAKFICSNGSQPLNCRRLFDHLVSRQ